jgi:hypothetical protein
MTELQWMVRSLLLPGFQHLFESVLLCDGALQWHRCVMCTAAPAAGLQLACLKPGAARGYLS